MMMQNLAPETRLADNVYLLNDEVRWGRVDLAAGRCTEGYRSAFVRSRGRWGRAVQIGDVDVTNLSMLRGGAQALVTYAWIDQRTMELRATTVRQSWVGEGDGFRLAGEDVVAGDDGLFDDVPGGPQRLPESEGVSDPTSATAGSDAAGTDTSSDTESVVVSSTAREPTPGERALAATRPRRVDSQGRPIP